MVRSHPSGVTGAYEARARRIVVNERREGKRLETVIIDRDLAVYAIHTGRKAPRIAPPKATKVPPWDQSKLEVRFCIGDNGFTAAEIASHHVIRPEPV